MDMRKGPSISRNIRLDLPRVSNKSEGAKRKKEKLFFFFFFFFSRLRTNERTDVLLLKCCENDRKTTEAGDF